MNLDAPIIGIDIGGANTKIASLDTRIAELHYIPMWKDTSLPLKLKEIAQRLSPSKSGVVMTGELADCFSDKEEGIRFIMDAVDAAFPNALYLNNKGEFINGDRDIRSLAAANWTASALVAGKEEDCIFVDLGSTTTDLIPVKNGTSLAGETDFKRLGRHELLYRGILRTNIATLMSMINLGQNQYRVSSELFAQTADVHLLLGNIKPEDYTCDTPDGYGKTIAEAARRLARVVCADTSELDNKEIMIMASQIYERQRNELAEAMNILASKYGINKIVGAGLGEFLIEDAARHARLACTLLSDIYGTAISKVFPAYAVAYLLNEV
ncbi:MAG: H4MPT-linked C1 transfer pathway protein [Methanosarcinales archaeon]|nr:H4MPT-linked C1 transfer pathway protein [Methanosarcinales archaeon]